VTIRPAERSDCQTICDLIYGLAIYEKLADKAVATPGDIERDLFGPNPVIRVLIAEDEGEAIGFALFFRSYSTFLGRPGIYLEDLYVREEHRGRGIGKALLGAVAEIAIAEGAGRFEWSVLDWNEPAIGFYKKMGAELMDGWTTCRLEGEKIGAFLRGPADEVTDAV
jgi:GNAT superfamily N-acetyltransferase